MVSTSHPKDGDEQMIQLDTDPWIKHLNLSGIFALNNANHQQKIRKHRLIWEMKLTPKTIFISESLSPLEKEDLICLVRDYINVFA